jgi:hypothetical protein
MKSQPPDTTDDSGEFMQTDIVKKIKKKEVKYLMYYILHIAWINLVSLY